MWGNLGLASEEKREVPVPSLLPGQVGVVSVAFVAPVMEGTYTSHWRLAHRGCQFGPRVWCSIVVKQSGGRSTLGHQSKRLASLQTSAIHVLCWLLYAVEEHFISLFYRFYIETNLIQHFVFNFITILESCSTFLSMFLCQNVLFFLVSTHFQTRHIYLVRSGPWIS